MANTIELPVCGGDAILSNYFDHLLQLQSGVVAVQFSHSSVITALTSPTLTVKDFPFRDLVGPTLAPLTGVAPQKQAGCLD